MAPGLCWSSGLQHLHDRGRAPRIGGYADVNSVCSYYVRGTIHCFEMKEMCVKHSELQQNNGSNEKCALRNKANTCLKKSDPPPLPPNFYYCVRDLLAPFGKLETGCVKVFLNAEFYCRM
jgi:hypothetical protein